MAPDTPNADQPPPRWDLDALMDRQRRVDALGYRIHLAAACCSLALLAGPTTVSELAGIPVTAVALVRLWSTWRLWLLILVQPHMLALLAWTAWAAASILWSADRAQGLEAVGQIRWVWLPLTLWPVIERRRTLLLALTIGFLVGNLAQALNAAGPALGLFDPLWPRATGRHSGWWDPVVAGSLLTGIVGLHLPALVSRGSPSRFRSVALLAALVGVLATGSRGAWIATAALLGASALLALSRPAVRARIPRRALALGTLAALLAALALAPSLAHRARAAWSDLSAALHQHDFRTDTGSRILLNWWACQAFAEHPVAGVGVGGFRAWTEQNLQRRGIDPSRRILHDHAHNAPLHAAATTGLIGLALALVFTALCLRNARVCARAGPTPDAGPLLAMAGLLLVGLFDSIHVNAQTAALWMALVALCPARTPARPS